jgi:hypothetical protein
MKQLTQFETTNLKKALALALKCLNGKLTEETEQAAQAIKTGDQNKLEELMTIDENITNAKNLSCYEAAVLEIILKLGTRIIEEEYSYNDLTNQIYSILVMLEKQRQQKSQETDYENQNDYS